MLGGLGQGQILLADRGYDSDVLRARLTKQGAWGNIKPMPHRVNIPSFSRYLYRFRNLVERFFNKLKHFRAVGHASKSPTSTTSPSSNSPPSGYGFGL
jgi:transposase